MCGRPSYRRCDKCGKPICTLHAPSWSETKMSCVPNHEYHYFWTGCPECERCACWKFMFKCFFGLLLLAGVVVIIVITRSN